MTIDDTFRSALERLQNDLQAQLDASLRRQADELHQRAEAERAAAVEQAVAAARREADTQLQQARQDHARQQDELRRSAEQQIGELRQLLEELRHTAQQQIDHARQSLESEIAAARRRADAEAEDARRLAQTQVDDVQREMQVRVDAATRELEAARRDLDARTGELATVRRDLDSRTGELEAVRRELNARSHEVEARTRELEASRQEAQSARRALDEARGATSQLSGERRRLEALVDGLRNLDEASGLGDVLDRLTHLAVDEADRSAVLLIKDAALQEWRSIGFSASQNGPRQVALEEAGLAGAAARDGHTLTRRAAEGGANPPIVADPELGGHSRDAAACPVLVAGTPVAVLYADAPAADGGAPAWFDVVAALARHAGLVLEATTVRQAAGLTPIARRSGAVSSIRPSGGI